MTRDPFIAWLQSRLTAHGFPCGPVDGFDGRLTRDALKGFQRKIGVNPNAVVDPTTEMALKLSASYVSDAVKAALPNRDDNDDPAIQKIALVDQRFPRQKDVPAFYGPVGQSQTTIDVPFDLLLAWDKKIRVRKITLHEKVAASGLRVLQAIASIYSAEERAALGLNIFGGSLNVRRMRGGSAYSMHSWGIAIDFDPERNALQTKASNARLSHADAKPFWNAFAAEGWLSLGCARDFDWMHVQAARL